MILTKIAFMLVVALPVLAAAGLVYWLLTVKKQVSFKISVGIGVLIGALVWSLIMNYKSNLIIINDDVVSTRYLLGNGEFDLSNGDKIELAILSHGETIINNTADSCVIQRHEYGDDEIGSDLLNMLILVKPMGQYAFHGNEIDYVFEERDNYIKTYGSNNNEVEKYSLRFLSQSDKNKFDLFDGKVEWGIPKEGVLYEMGSGYYSGGLENGAYQGHGVFVYENGDLYEGNYEKGLKEGDGKFTFSNGDYYEGGFHKDKFEGQGSFYSADGEVVKGAWKRNEYVEGQ